MENQNLTIMFTDIKGFTPRTASISREKLHELLELHDSLILPVFDKFGGTLVKTIGDAFMVTFHSPTDAVLCGIKIQDVLTKHNSKASKEEQLEVRVALNSGEVTIKKNDVFGEAVNIAARLEGIAEAGDIYFTEAIYLSMNKSEIPTAEVGFKHFKGVPGEVKVYKVLNENAIRNGATQKKREFSPIGVPANSGNMKKYLKIGAILVIAVLLLLVLTSGNRKARNEEGVLDADVFMSLSEEEKAMLKEKAQHIEGNLNDEERLIEVIKEIYFEAESAIEDSNPEFAMKRINTLRKLADEFGNPPEIEEAIQRLEKMFHNRFER